MARAAARYCRGKRLSQLDPGEIELLYNRLVSSREQTADEEHEAAPAPRVLPNKSARETLEEMPDILPAEPASRSANGRSRN
jgi:hypothetical protein